MTVASLVMVEVMGGKMIDDTSDKTTNERELAVDKYFPANNFITAPLQKR